MIGIGVLVLLVLVFFVRGRKSGSEMDGDMTSDSQETLLETFTGSLKDAAALNTPMRCSYSIEGMEYESAVKGKRFVGSVIGPDGSESTVLMLDNCMYTWSDAQDQGVKMCFDTEENDIWEVENTEALAESYVCRPASVSESEFEIPSDVEFVDMNSYMQGDMPIPMGE